MKRVFIFSSRSLFSQGIKNLLDAEPELDVIGWETDLEQATRFVQEMQPDTILVIAKGRPPRTLSDGQHLLAARGKATIVELNLEDSNVCVYCGEQLAIKEIGDLVKIIEESTAALS